MDFIREDLSFKRESFREREERLGTKLVDMDQVGSIRSTPGKRAAIGTFALSGCTGLAVILENPSNLAEKAAIIAHYDPMMLALNHHREGLKGVLRQVKSTHLNPRAFIVSPGWGDPNSSTGFAATDNEKERIDGLTNIVKEELGEHTPVTSLGYQTTASRENTDRGTILVEFSKEEAQPTKFYVDGVPIKLS